MFCRQVILLLSLNKIDSGKQAHLITAKGEMF